MKQPHGNAKNPRWWHRAAEAERLAQVAAGIELGMTCQQIGANCGCDKAAVIRLAAKHGLRFAGRSLDARGPIIAAVRARRRRGLTEAKKAYWHGEPVDMWRSKPAIAEPLK